MSYTCNQANGRRAEEIREMCVLVDVYALKGTGRDLGDFSSDKLPVLSGTQRLPRKSAHQDFIQSQT